MANKIWYPNRKHIIKANDLMIKMFPASKSEKHKVLGSYKIDEAIKETKEFPGSRIDKSAVLLRTLANKHPFASANRRTAYYVTNEFLWKNEGYGIAKKEKSGKKFMYKVRQGMSHNRIKKELGRRYG
jgi:prophage maintenance system killer protein